MYNWQLPDWPEFHFDQPKIDPLLHRYEEKIGTLQARIATLPEADGRAFMLDRMVEEAHSTSSIEGEYISREQLMSSLLNNLTIGRQRHAIRDMRASGIMKQIEANRQTLADPLTETTLKYWQELIVGFDQSLRVIGDYRRGHGPMRIVSGPSYDPTVHFEAPPAERVSKEMPVLIDYCNRPVTHSIDWVKKAGVAHLWFECIHPFEDGNGRIGRALMEKLLSRGLRSFVPFSISQAIETNRTDYYAALQASQTTLDITAWMEFFSQSLINAVIASDTLVGFTVRKHQYYQRFGDSLSPEEGKAIAKMFEAGPEGFQGGMTAKKYTRINRVSRATATRALQHLTEIGALLQRGRGRATHYVLPFGGDAE